MHPNLVEHLSAFILVAEHRSFSAAARELGRAVSSVSYSLSQLEAYCGFPLLERGAGGAQLTDRGRALLAEAKSVVERGRRFASRVRTLEKGEETRLRVAVDVLFPLNYLHDALRIFSARHEHARLQIFTTSFNTAWDDLRADKVDFAVGLLAALPLDMEGRAFRQITMSPAAASHHRLAALDRPLSLADFASERQIYYVGSYDLELERAGRTFSPELWTANDLEHIRLMVTQGFGWSFATEHHFRDELAQEKVRLLTCVDAQLHPIRSLGVAWPAERQPGPLGRGLIELIGDATSADTRS